MPTVLGRLSFSAIGLTDHPAPCETANVADNYSRFIVSCQTRDTLDAIVPFKHKLTKYWIGLEGHMFFACVARCPVRGLSRLDSLSGSLFVFHNEAMWFPEPDRIIRFAQKRLKEIDKHQSDLAYLAEHGTENLLDREFLGEYEKLTRNLQSLSSFSCSFELLRTGEIELSWSPDIPASPYAPRMPSGIEGELTRLDVVAQLFYYIKDISHTHQHHNPRTDTVTTIYEALNDEILWRIFTLYSIYKKIIQYKRVKDELAAVTSRGTLAYAQAFRSICEKSPRLDAEYKTSALPDFDDSSLLISLDAAESEGRARREMRTTSWVILITVTIGFFGTVFALFSLLQFSDKKPSVPASDILVEAVELVLRYPIVPFGFVLVVVFSVLFRLEIGIGFRSLRVFAFNVTRAALYGKKFWAEVILLLLSFLISVCGLAAAYSLLEIFS